MGLGDLASWVSRQVSGADDSHRVTDRHRDLAAAAESDTLAPEALAKPGDRTTQPVAAYLEDDEQPHYLLHGGRLLVEDAEGSLDRKHPTRQLVVLVSDRRVLFVVGGRLADDCLDVPLSAVTDIYLDEDGQRRHVVLDADRDGDRMTFFADVTVDPRTDELADAVEFVRQRA